MLTGAWAGRVGQDSTVRDGRVFLIERHGHGERRFECRFVEAGKCAPRVARFELGHRVFAIVCLADVEPAQLIVERAAEADVNVRRPAWNDSRDGQRDGLLSRIDGRVGFLRASARTNRGVPDAQIRRVQHDAGDWLGRVNADRLAALESLVLEVDDERHIVVIGPDAARQLLGCGRRRDAEPDNDEGEYEGAHGLSLSVATTGWASPNART